MCHKDVVSVLTEEVALEGLDGITVQGLWLRLEDRLDFGLKPTTSHIKQALWNIIVRISCFEFYILPQPRKSLKIFDKISCYDDQGNNVLPAGYEDIYPHCPVNDEATGLIGSCRDYSTRVKITEEVVKASLDQVWSKWGFRLVIVASQDARRTALCGHEVNPCWEFSVNEYCMLERVGRSRRHGEITHGHYGLKLLNDDNKMLFYYRKSLIRRGLITTQTFVIRIKTSNVSGKIIHLKRFSTPVKSKIQNDCDLIVGCLKVSTYPGGVFPYSNLQKLAIKCNIKKVLKRMDKNVVSELVPYRQVYPDAAVSEWKYKGSPTEKTVRVLRLISEEKDDEEEDDPEEEENLGTGVLDESARCVGVPLMRQAYVALERSHTTGMTQSELARHLGLPHLTARAICKQLKRYRLCSSTLRDMGRQRVSVFYCNKFDTLKSSVPSAVANEKSKLLQILQNKNPQSPESSRKRGSVSLDVKTSHGEFSLPSDRRSTQTTKITLKKSSELENIKTEVVVLKPDIRVGKFSGLLDGGDDQSNLSLRLLKRANLILKAVNNLKIIHDPQKLQRMINDEEEQEGLSYTVDRKSVLRIIEKLELEGHLQRIRVTLNGNNKEKVFTFICHPSITPQHSEIQSAIEQARMKLPIITKEIVKCSRGSQVLNSMKQDYDHRIGKTQYGFKPKFIRLRNMHFYLYYLIYNYSGCENISYSTKRNILKNNNLDESLLKEMGKIYQDKLDWKMFIPPLPKHKDYSEGWCLVSDILLRLPLFMFLSLVNTPYRIPGIMDYLDHPLRKYYLVKDLPPEISNHLTILRKYIFTLSEILQQLAFIGLVQFGAQLLKEKDQVFIFLNKNAMLVDTTSSDEGYNHVSRNKTYDRKLYHFSTTDDLENYWSDLVKFAMNTKLGVKACVVGREVVVESVGTKKQMLEALRPKSCDEAVRCDVGYMPGDGLGAAGVDSDMFVHLKRNWYWSTSLQDKRLQSKPSGKQKLDEPIKKPSLKSEKAKKIKVVSIEKHETEKTTKNKLISGSKYVDRNSYGYSEQRGSFKEMIVTTQKTLIPDKTPRRSHKKVTRYVLPYNKISVRKPYYDQKDKEALKRMEKLRVDWTSKEDNILLLCKVANIFMCPYSLRKKMKNYASIREILHKNLPECSLNKTSRACQRRITYMIKNPYTAHSVDICVEELNQDKDLISKYGHTSMNKLLNKHKDQDSNNEEFNKVYDKYFLELVDLLMNRIKSVSFNKSVLENDFIPDSLETFYAKYTLAVPCPKKRLGMELYREAEDTTDIMNSVIKSVIHSSLACLADKTCYSYQLFHIYQQYPDKLLRTAVTELRNASVLAAKKFHYLKRISNEDKCLPISSGPYKLSNMYMNRLQTKFQHRIYSESYYYFSNIISVIDGGEPDPDTDRDIEVNITSGGECALIVELVSKGLIVTQIDFPDQVIILDPKLSDTEETFSKILKRFNDLISNMKSKSTNSCKGYETDCEDAELIKYDCSYEEFNYSNRNTLASAASRLALFSLRDDSSETSDTNIQHAHDYFVINPCRVSFSVKQETSDPLQSLFTDCQEKNECLSSLRKLSILPDFKKRPCDKDALKDLDPAAAQLLSYIKEGKELGVATETVLQTFGCSIVNDVKQLLQKQLILMVGVVSLRLVHHRFSKPWVISSYSLPRSIKDSLATGSERMKELKVKGKDISDINVVSSTDLIYENRSEIIKQSEPTKSSSDAAMSDVAVSDCSHLLEVGKHEERGDKKRKTEEECQDTEPFQIRKKLRSADAIKPKLSTFSGMKGSECLKDIEVLMKPWVRVDGSLNRRVLDRLLSSLLSHILNCPGLSLTKLQTRFSPALQPSHVHELVLYLDELKCISLSTTRHRPVTSLFSTKSQVLIEQATGLEQPSNLFLEPDSMAITKLGLFIGDKVYSGFYMDPSCSSNVL